MSCYGRNQKLYYRKWEAPGVTFRAFMVFHHGYASHCGAYDNGIHLHDIYFLGCNTLREEGNQVEGPQDNFARKSHAVMQKPSQKYLQQLGN